jgi:hypothetical protein
MSPTAAPSRIEIFKVFSTLLETHTSLQLHNFFRGVPVIFPAQVKFIDQDAVVLKVHCLQSVVISIEKRTYIRSDLLPVVIRALPKTINFSSQEVVLTHFSSAGKAFIERAHLRVQPVEPINVEILKGERLTIGTLADISLSETGVFAFGAYISDENSLEMSANSEVGLNFTLQGLYQLIHLVGTITNVAVEKRTMKMRIGIQTLPEPAVDSALMKYIDRRQADILGELQKIYQRTCPSKKV